MNAQKHQEGQDMTHQKQEDKQNKKNTRHDMTDEELRRDLAIKEFLRGLENGMYGF